MEQHIQTKTTALDNNNPENDLLLNAIKIKFAAQTANEVAAASFSPPKFTIPTLKISGNATTTSNSLGTNQLNAFLIKQLQDNTKQEIAKETTSTNGFVLPNLKFCNNKPLELGTKFEIPLLKTSATNSGVSSLTTAINKLQLDKNTSTHPFITETIPTTTPATIDLTTALASKSAPFHQGTPPTRDFQIKQKQQSSTADSDFDIPFIDCDRLDAASYMKKSEFLAPTNEYCQIDISQLALKPTTCVQQPSSVGRFMCIVEKHYITRPLICITSAEQYKKNVKHEIKPFQFDTKSPDDMVLEALNKYRRPNFK